MCNIGGQRRGTKACVLCPCSCLGFLEVKRTNSHYSLLLPRSGHAVLSSCGFPPPPLPPPFNNCVLYLLFHFSFLLYLFFSSSFSAPSFFFFFTFSSSRLFLLISPCSSSFCFHGCIDLTFEHPCLVFIFIVSLG